MREVAALLRLSTAIVYRLVDRGELGHARVSNAIRIARSDVGAYLDERQHRRPTE